MSAGIPNFPQVLPGQTVVGRLSALAGSPEAIPLATLRQQVALSNAMSLNAKDYGAVGDGNANDAPGINAALAAAFATGFKIVILPTGSYRLGSAVVMQPGVRLKGNGSSTLTQANGANLTTLVDFGTANGARLERITVDGNRANNTDNSLVVLVHMKTAADAVVEDCTIVNSNGYCVASNGLRPTIQRNRMSNCFVQNIGIFSQSGGISQDAFVRIQDNFLDSPGFGPIIISDSNYALVRGNRITGSIIGGRGSRMTVNTSGTTVTWVSGPNFVGVKPGMFVTVNNGQEFQVTAVGSSTSLTVATTLPTLVGTQAAVGSGDLCGIVASQHCIVTENHFYGGVTFGVGLSLGGRSYQCSHNIIANNNFSFSGKNAVNVAYDSGSGFMQGNQILDNKMFNPGNSGGVGPNDQIGIFVACVSTGKVFDTFIDGNSVFTNADADNQTQWWLGVDGLAAAIGSVKLGNNTSANMLNQGIKNDVVSIVLDAGWGSTASTSGIVSHGRSVMFTVTANGAGIAGSPGITINKICTGPEVNPLILSKMVSGTGTNNPLFGEQNSTTAAWKTFYGGTPVAASTYQIIVKM